MSESTPEPKEAEPRKRVAPLLVRTLIASTALHLLPLTGLLQFAWTDSSGFEVDWNDTFGDLSGVGHGSSGRWAKLDDAPPPPEESEEKKAPEEAPEEKEKVAPEEKPKEPEKKVAEKEKPRKKPKPKKKKPEKKEKLAVKDEKKPAPPKEDAEPKKEKEPKEVAENTDDEKEEPTPPTVASRDPGDLPGLRRSGPSNLPNFKDYAPGNARMTALFRLDRIRGTGLDASVTKALGAVPDFHILMNSTGVVPTRDLSSVFAASADPRYIQETFWAFRHGMGKKDFKDALSRRFEQDVPWTTYKKMPRRAMVPEGLAYKDPRAVVLVDEELALVTQPHWLPLLTRDLAEDSAIRDPGAEDAPATMLDGLARIEQAADDSNAFAMLSYQGLGFVIPGYGRLPYFETVRISLADAAAPKVTIDLQFRNTRSAARFARDCPKLKNELNSLSMRALSFGHSAKVMRLKCEASEEFVTVRGEYTQAEVVQVLELVHTLMPQPLAASALPPAPQKKRPVDPAAGPDAGTPPGPDAGATDAPPAKGTVTKVPAKGSGVGSGLGALPKTPSLGGVKKATPKAPNSSTTGEAPTPAPADPNTPTPEPGTNEDAPGTKTNADPEAKKDAPEGASSRDAKDAKKPAEVDAKATPTKTPTGPKDDASSDTETQ